MVRVTIIARVRSEKRDEFMDAMDTLQKERLGEQGILSSRVYECREDLTRFVFIDEWKTDQHLKKYCDQEGFRVLLGALRTLCLEADVRYDLPDRSKEGLRVYGFKDLLFNRKI